MSKDVVPAERIENKILRLRGQRVMLDRHPAALYGAKTRALNQAVKRNADRSPPDFMFRLTREEMLKTPAADGWDGARPSRMNKRPPVDRRWRDGLRAVR